MPKLSVVFTSTRPGRAGLPVATWFVEKARAHPAFDVELVDLRDVNLPLFDEPHHPRLRKYEHEHTKAWSKIVASSDAFVFVTPEYNYAMSPALLNALDFLYSEWNYKAAAIVSYGGVSGGMRAAQMAKQILPTLRMMPIPEGVSVPFFTKLIDEKGVLTGNELLDKSATAVLDELLRWTTALAPLRA